MIERVEMADTNDLLGAGIYTIPQAARLVGVQPSALRRWMRGYSSRTRDGSMRQQRPVFERDFPDLPGGRTALSFMDLVEALFIHAFLRHGVSWHHVRESAVEAAELFESNHPFCVRQFSTDGRRIFGSIAERTATADEHLVELVSRQAVFTEVVSPLLKRLDYETTGEREARSWWPLGRSTPIVLDPRRSRGVPVAARSGVPAYILANAVAAEGGDVAKVARWYEVERREVRAAVQFEQRAA